MPFDLRDLTAKIHFVNKRDEVQFTSIQFIGGCGVLTAVKPQRFGIVVNFRNSAYCLAQQIHVHLDVAALTHCKLLHHQLAGSLLPQ